MNKLTILKLNLRSNNVMENGARFLGDALKNLVNIKSISINLTNNKIKNEGLKHISDGINAIKNLTNLKLSVMSAELNDASE